MPALGGQSRELSDHMSHTGNHKHKLQVGRGGGTLSRQLPVSAVPQQGSHCINAHVHVWRSEDSLITRLAWRAPLPAEPSCWPRIYTIALRSLL